LDIEETLVLIKPHAVAAGWTNGIYQRYRTMGATIEQMHIFTFTSGEVAEFYAEHVGREYFPALATAMCEGPTLALLLRASNGIAKVRELHGVTEPSRALPGTIRYDFRGKGGPYNTVHASDSPEAVRRESRFIFTGTKMKVSDRIVFPR